MEFWLLTIFHTEFISLRGFPIHYRLKSSRKQFATIGNSVALDIPI